MKVHVLEAGFRKRHPYKVLRETLFRPIWFPVQNARWELKSLGIEVKFFAEIAPGLADCDVLILSSRTVDSLVASGATEARDRAAFCQRFAAPGRKVIWFDSRDSAGNCQFDVLPFISVYLKRQIYRDRSLYTKPMYYGRIHSDYYHEKDGVSDDARPADESALTSERSATPYVETERSPGMQGLEKMRAAWGCGAEYHWPLFNKLSFIGYFASAAARTVSARVETRPVVVSPSVARPKTIAALFDDQRYSLKSVGHQRALGLAASKALNVPDKAIGRVPRNAFYSTLAASQVTISTFGWGEVCYREYEATYCGSTVLMADMSCIETFPNLYVPDVYYVPYQWDFTDFEEKCMALLNDTRRREEIARNAQAMLMEQWTQAGRQRFAERFQSLLA